MNEFWLCFVPLFVAVDAIGVLPMFVSLTEGINPRRVRTVIFQSVFTASAVALLFLWFGPSLMRFLGITVSDFMIGGGLLLLIFSLSDLLTGEKKQRQTDPEDLGAVPIGVPLITGPGVLTTCILLTELHGWFLTAAAVIVNIAIAGTLFLFADPMTRVIGKTGSKIISKVASLLLTAIAVMLIRKGITGIIKLAA